MTSMEYVDAQENLKSGDAMGLWVGESEQTEETSLESTGGHARQQQQRWRGQPSLAEGDKERQLEARRLAILLSVSIQAYCHGQ